MLNVENLASYLLDRGLIDVSWILDGNLTIRSVARRNRNLKVEGPGGAGLFLKQSDDPDPGGQETLCREASFHRFCQDEPAAAEVARIIPHLTSGGDGDEPVLVFEAISDSISLWSHMETEGGQGAVVEAARALGLAMGTVHRVLRGIVYDGDARLARLPRSLPWALSLHRPAPSSLASLTGGGREVLRVLQTQEDFAERLHGLAGLWQPSAVIHGDVQFDNVLIRPQSSQDKRQRDNLRLWLTDWEMVQFGDPAWDLAGALQDFLFFWVSRMPLSGELTAEQMVAQAAVPLADLRRATRALWAGYRNGAGLGTAEAEDLLRRAVTFSAVRLNQTAFEDAQGASSLPGRAMLLLQISANLLAEPDGGQIELYGIPLGLGLS
jgi:hypothetical protein